MFTPENTKRFAEVSQKEEVSGYTPETLQPYIRALAGYRFWWLQFPPELEAHFEKLTGDARCHRLWLEGLIAIVLVTVCLVLDCVAVRDARWSAVVWELLLITPVSLLANEVIRRRPSPRVREVTVAFAICLISATISLSESPTGAVGVIFAESSLIICALFGSTVMRLRLPYAVGVIFFLLAQSVFWCLHTSFLNSAERAISLSLSTFALGLTMLASYSLEKDERLTFLLQQSVELKNEEIARANLQLLHLSHSDPLTSLANRRRGQSYLEQELQRAAELQSSFSIILVDIDHFKQINDTYGHPYGDEVLRRVGTLLPSCLHSKRDLVARWGGEEFLIVLPETGSGGARIVAERICALVRATASPPFPHAIVVKALLTTVSCGVATCELPLGEEVVQVLVSADRALYDAKRGGRNRVVSRKVTAASLSVGSSDEELVARLL